jgi:hypothetical protein
MAGNHAARRPVLDGACTSGAAVPRAGITRASSVAGYFGRAAKGLSREFEGFESIHSSVGRIVVAILLWTAIENDLRSWRNRIGMYPKT